MGEHTKIEWCDHSVNLWWGCVEVHAGCDNCYAHTFSHRWGEDLWGADKPRRRIASAMHDLYRYQQLAEKAGEMHRVFVGSMMDIFEKPMPCIDQKGNSLPYDTGSLRDILFHDISNGIYPNLLFLFLTKRPSNIKKYIPKEWYDAPPANVMFGTSPVDGATLRTLVPQLLNSISKGKGKFFLSVEPMLEEISILDYLYMAEMKHLLDNKIDWIIVGGESGPHKRAFDADWARKIKKDCGILGIPFFMKQMDKVEPIPDDLMIREFPEMQIKLH